MAFIRDITQRKLAEAKLEETRALAQEQQRAWVVLEERRQLARNLHDSVNQSIHSLALFSETLTSLLEKKQIKRAQHTAERLEESARLAVKEFRLMLYELQAPAVEKNLDLFQELETRLAMVEHRAGMEARVEMDGSLNDCPQQWRENLFWITIEALNNTLKHAQARSVVVRFHFRTEYIEVEIQDDGIGFDPLKKRYGNLGLPNMRERAAMLGGTLTFNTAPGQGTLVHFHADIKDI
jgi:signal transduction histidine kinase